MRTLALIGSLFFITGIFLCTRDAGSHFGHLLAGAVVGLLGLLILGLTANSEPTEPEVPARRAKSKSKNRLRRRSTTGIRSLRMRRAPAAGGR